MFDILNYQKILRDVVLLFVEKDIKINPTIYLINDRMELFAFPLFDAINISNDELLIYLKSIAIILDYGKIIIYSISLNNILNKQYGNDISILTISKDNKYNNLFITMYKKENNKIMIKDLNLSLNKSPLNKKFNNLFNYDLKTINQKTYNDIANLWDNDKEKMFIGTICNDTIIKHKYLNDNEYIQ